MTTIQIQPFDVYAPAFSQVAPAYAKLPLGISNTTIGGYGCLLCSLTSVLFDWEILIDGRDADPAMVNRWLARNGGYTAPANNQLQKNRLVFDSLRPLGVALVDIVDCSKVPAPADRIARYLADPDYAILAEVDFVPGGAVQQHWVRLLPEWLDITPDEQVERFQTDVMIMDPWMPSGSEFRWLMPSYAVPSWANPARAIFRVAVYKRLSTESNHDAEAPSKHGTEYAARIRRLQ